MAKKEQLKEQLKKAKKQERNYQKQVNIIESALRIFGEKGFEATTISEICKEAKISDATLYEYFASKEEVLFSIAEYFTGAEIEKIKRVNHYIHNTRERMRMLIQAHLEFYENNRLYSSVALLTLKGNRSFVKSKAYDVVRESTRGFVDTYREGVEKGIFRKEIDEYLFRNMVLGFIEHLVIQWLLTGRPAQLSTYRDTIFDMVMRAVEIQDNTNSDKPSEEYPVK